MIAAFIVLLVAALALGGYILYMYLHDRKKPALPAVAENSNVSADGSAENEEEIDIVFDPENGGSEKE